MLLLQRHIVYLWVGWYANIHTLLERYVEQVCKCIHYNVYNDLTAQGPCRLQGVYGIHITFCASRYVKVQKSTSGTGYKYRGYITSLSIQSSYRPGCVSPVVPFSGLNLNQFPLLPFHLSRPSVGKNSDNHHNVKASQGAKVLFYNLVILKPLVVFSESSERKQASDHRRVPSPCIPIMINLHKMLFRKVS